MGELVNRGESAIVPEGFYKQVSSILNAARDKAYTAVNFAMVEAYWEIGKSIVDEQGGEERAKYGEALLKALAIRLTKDFGKGFGARELRKMRQFYLAFPIRDGTADDFLDRYAALPSAARISAGVRPPSASLRLSVL